MKPRISIIIPVYNVEQYLAECLDSIINQTMQDIQIICVNDGSPDGSRAILQEYADRDSRIQIIDKPNGGLSSARNAAYPYIQGKYTLFVDSDDWIELDLCEKTYRKAEESNAPMILFFYLADRKSKQRPVCPLISSNDKYTVEEKHFLLGSVPYSAWSKLWRTDFLLDNNLYFPEGLAFEDVPVHWKAVVLADHIAVLPELLYHYRHNNEGIMQSRDKHFFDIVPVFAHVHRFLVESGHYPSYKDEYHRQKLREIRGHYERLPAKLQQEFKWLIRDNLTDDDREYFRSGKAGKDIARFYEIEIEGNPIAIMKKHVSKIVKLPEQALRHWVIKPIKKRLKAA